jgi:hypothetical protein
MGSQAQKTMRKVILKLQMRSFSMRI